MIRDGAEPAVDSDRYIWPYTPVRATGRHKTRAAGAGALASPLRKRARLFRLAAALALFALAAPPVAAETVTVFAAASLTDVLDAAIAVWHEDSDDRVVAVYAASSVLARQIEAGAPAALFLSANVEWMAYLDERGLLAPGSRVDRLGNRLVLAAPAGTAPPQTLAAALGPAGPLARGRLALADPDHVPAGRYAREALEALGLWSAVGPRAVRTGDVRATAALIARGEVPLGIVYRTDLALCSGCREVAAFPAGSHAPIVYPLALVAERRTAAAAAFRAFLLGARAAAVFRAFGFLVNE